MLSFGKCTHVWKDRVWIRLKQQQCLFSWVYWKRWRETNCLSNVFQSGHTNNARNGQHFSQHGNGWAFGFFCETLSCALLSNQLPFSITFFKDLSTFPSRIFCWYTNACFFWVMEEARMRMKWRRNCVTVSSKNTCIWSAVIWRWFSKESYGSGEAAFFTQNINKTWKHWENFIVSQFTCRIIFHCFGHWLTEFGFFCISTGENVFLYPSKIK